MCLIDTYNVRKSDLMVVPWWWPPITDREGWAATQVSASASRRSSSTFFCKAGRRAPKGSSTAMNKYTRNCLRGLQPGPLPHAQHYRRGTAAASAHKRGMLFASGVDRQDKCASPIVLCCWRCTPRRSKRHGTACARLTLSRTP